MAKPENANAFFLSAIDQLRDPVRDTRWRVLIPEPIWTAIDGVLPTHSNTLGQQDELGDNFALHVKTCTIPGIETKMDFHNYMGFKSAYPVNSEISASLNFQTILLEDMAAYELVNAWNQVCLNTGLLQTKDGEERVSGFDGGANLGLGNHKNKPQDGAKIATPLKNQVINVELYNWANGNVILSVILQNAWPTKVEPMQFKYSPDAKLQNFSFTLYCDRWSIRIPDAAYKDSIR